MLHGNSTGARLTMRTVLPASGVLKHTQSELSSPLLVKTSKVCLGLLGALRSSMRAFSCLPSVLRTTSSCLAEALRGYERRAPPSQRSPDVVAGISVGTAAMAPLA